MPTCFVILPFDAGKYDKRYDDVFKPSLEQAGLDAYRVDRDPAVEVPIESIEEGIRDATMCLADITTNNPNVWYELGYAFARDRSVIMLCADERKDGYPFDIRHRSVIQYRSDSTSDFDDLREKITARAANLIEKGAAARQIIETEQTALQDGLSQIEILVLALAAAEADMPNEAVSGSSLKHTAEQSGLTGVGYGLAIKRLQQKGFVECDWTEDYPGQRNHLVAVSDRGWKWIDNNDRLFDLKKSNTSRDFDDDIPF